jgi:hypothetical protein
MRENNKRMFMGLRKRGVPLICLQRVESPSMARYREYYKGEGGGFPQI